MLRVLITALPLAPAGIPFVLLKLKTVKSNILILFTNIIIPATYMSWMMQSGWVDKCTVAAEVKFGLDKTAVEEEEDVKGKNVAVGD